MSTAPAYKRFNFSHNSIGNTSITHSDGGLLYIVDTPKHLNPLARKPPTIIRHPAKVLKDTNQLVEGETIATIDWRKWYVVSVVLLATGT